MATFWERAAHSVLAYVLFVFLPIVILVISHIGFEGGTLVLNASVPGHYLSITFSRWFHSVIVFTKKVLLSCSVLRCSIVNPLS